MSTGCASGGNDRAVIDELMEKIVQLTKVIVFLHTRSDGHDSRCAALREACEEEVSRVKYTSASRVESHRLFAGGAASRREQRLAAFRENHDACEDDAKRSIAELRKRLKEREEAETKRLDETSRRRTAKTLEIRRRADRLKCELGAAESRARNDRQWLIRQLAGETARERQQIDQEFEARSASLQAEHALEVEELRRAREVAVAEARASNGERLTEAQAEADKETARVLEQQTAAFEEERQGLVDRAENVQEPLSHAREVAGSAKAECADQQRLLDEMSRELQDRKRRNNAISADVDTTHTRRLKAEGEIRELRRQKAAIERSLASAQRQAGYGGHFGESGASSAIGAAATGSHAPQTERAFVGLSEDVRSAQARLGVLRNELGRSRRMLDQRRNAVADCERQAAELGGELLNERQRCDELQRVLLRLEQST